MVAETVRRLTDAGLVLDTGLVVGAGLVVSAGHETGRPGPSAEAIGRPCTPARTCTTRGHRSAVTSFRTRHDVHWNLVSAAAILTMVPTVARSFFAQRALVQGVTLTGVEG